MRFVAFIAAACVGLSAQELRLGAGVNLYSVEQDAKLGRDAAEAFRKSVAVVTAPDVADYVASLVKRLAAKIPGLQYSFEVAIFDDRPGFESIDNAAPWGQTQLEAREPIGFPNGTLFIPVSMLKRTKTERELVHALAHAMAHIADRHVTRYLTRQQLVERAAAAMPANQRESAAAQTRMTMSSSADEYEKRANLWAAKWAEAAFPPTEQIATPEFTRVKRLIDSL